MDPFRTYTGPSKSPTRKCREAYLGATNDVARIVGLLLIGPYKEVCSTHVVKTGEHCPGKVVALIDNEYYCEDCIKTMDIMNIKYSARLDIIEEH